MNGIQAIQFKFYKKIKTLNHSQAVYRVRLLDGLQNIMPCGVGSDLPEQGKQPGRCIQTLPEHITDSSLVSFSLSAIIVDKAEPSEALKINTTGVLDWINPLYPAFKPAVCSISEQVKRCYRKRNPPWRKRLLLCNWGNTVQPARTEVDDRCRCKQEPFSSNWTAG